MAFIFSTECFFICTKLGMRGVALLAAHWNTPIFGWVSQEEEFQDKKMYSTLVRFLGPLNRFRK